MAKLKNPTLVQDSWRTKFEIKNAPTYKTILCNYKKFDLTGYVNLTAS
jgi:hypothetical protein